MRKPGGIGRNEISMPVVFQVGFPFDRPWGEDLGTAMGKLAADIAREPGLIWKIWTESPDKGRAGGVYLFATGEAARDYADKHLKRLAAFGIAGIVHHQLAINSGLSRITRFTGKDQRWGKAVPGIAERDRMAGSGTPSRRMD